MCFCFCFCFVLVSDKCRKAKSSCNLVHINLGGSLSIRLLGTGGGGGRGGEERKGKREEKPDTNPLRRVFRPLDEHDASPQIVANQNNFRSCNCHVSDDRCERYELKLHTQLHYDRLSKQNIFC